MSAEQNRTAEQPRVLVIESNRNFLGVVARRLAQLGHRVATAGSAHGGLAELYRMPVDLVLCDAKLSGTSGIEFVRMIREDPVHRDLPVLLIVGRSDSASAVKAFAAGADGTVRKPFHFEVLAAAITRHLERAESLKRLVEDNVALDARVISRAIEIREMREKLCAAESERRRLSALVEGKAA